MAATTDVKMPILVESQQLNKANWFDWKGRIITLTRIRGLHAHLNGTLTRPPPAPPGADPGDIALATAEQQQWDKHDEFAKAIITLNVVDFIGTGVEEEGKTAHEVWSALVQKWERKTALTITNAEDYLKACVWTEGTDLQDHFTGLRRRWHAARDLGSTFDAARFTIVICNSMLNLPSLRSTCTSLLLQTDPDIIMESILTVFENDRIQAGNLLNPMGSDQVAPQTTSVFMTRVKAMSICEWCGAKGHTQANCFCEGGGREGQQPSGWTKPVPKRGSPAAKALAVKQTSAASTTTTSGTAVPNAQVPPQAHLTTAVARPATVGEERASDYDYHIFLASAHLVNLPHVEPIKNGLLRAYANTGATHHCFVDRESFVDYMPLTPTLGNGAKKGSSFSIIGVGNVAVQMTMGGRTSVITFQNAIHTPDLAANLISMPRLDRAGYSFSGAAGLMHVMGKAGRTMFTCTLTSGDLYEAEFTKVDLAVLLDLPRAYLAYDHRALAVDGHGSAADIATWHRRLSHISEHTVQTMARSNVVSGMVVKGEHPTGKCEDCLKGKQTRAPFRSSKVETELLERVYVDLMGPFPVTSLGGARYLLTIDDGASSYTMVYPLANKSMEETLRHFQTYNATSQPCRTMAYSTVLLYLL